MFNLRRFNLVCASHVFLLEPSINPALEQQAVARCHRIGQTVPVYVTRLVIAGTIEQRILDARAPARAPADAHASASASATAGATAGAPASEPPSGPSASACGGTGTGDGLGVQLQRQPAPASGNERVHGEKGADTGSLLDRLFA
jgi:hypothetical protein